MNTPNAKSSQLPTRVKVIRSNETDVDDASVIDHVTGERIAVEKRSSAFPRTGILPIDQTFLETRRKSPIPLNTLTRLVARLVIPSEWTLVRWSCAIDPTTNKPVVLVPENTLLFLERRDGHIVLILVQVVMRCYMLIEGYPNYVRDRKPVEIGSVMTARRGSEIRYQRMNKERKRMRVFINNYDARYGFSGNVLDVIPWTSTHSEILGALCANAEAMEYKTMTQKWDLRPPFFYLHGSRFLPGQLSCDNFASLFFPDINRIDYGQNVCNIGSTPDAVVRLRAVMAQYPALLHEVVPARQTRSRSPSPPRSLSPSPPALPPAPDWHVVLTTAPVRPVNQTIRAHVINYIRLRGKTSLVPIGEWDVSGVTVMSYLFRDCKTFNESISKWDTSNVTTMEHMFANAHAFNQELNAWDTSNVTTMEHMFANAHAFNQPIGKWNTAAVMTMAHMFTNAHAFNQPIGKWNTVAVTTMDGMFQYATAFNQELNAWNTAAVKSMMCMFLGARVFNQALGAWNTSRVTDMSYMFSDTTAFNQALGTWDTSSVTDMSYMFSDTTAFNQTLNAWDTSNVTKMAAMFCDAIAFNQPIDAWNTARVTNMMFMFAATTVFNQPIGRWNTSAVTDMTQMFAVTTAFNQPIGAWDTSAVTTMSHMFEDAAAFNQPIGAWNVAKVRSMICMFHNAPKFNQSLERWQPAALRFTKEMFWMAKSFDSPLFPWHVDPNCKLDNMFHSSAFTRTLPWTVDPTIPKKQFLPDAVLETVHGAKTLAEQVEIYNVAADRTRKRKIWAIDRATPQS